MTGFGYSLPFRAMCGHVRSTPESRPHIGEVCFFGLKARFTLSIGRSEERTGWSQFDPKETFTSFRQTRFQQGGLDTLQQGLILIRQP